MLCDAEKNRILIKLAPYTKIQRDLRDGLASRIDVADLASEIREHGIDAMPEEVVGFLCDHLEGKIDKRGRKGLGLTDKRLTARRAALFYRAVRAAQQNPDNADETIRELIEEKSHKFPKPITDGEVAWRIVSFLFYGNDGHHRKLANLVSKHAPLRE